MNKEELIMESYPDALQCKIEARDRQERLKPISSFSSHALELVFEDLKLWRVGTLTVSFKGGTKELHKSIADTANIWTGFGNMEFDFGLNRETGTYRNWTPDDKSHIRVGFEFNGYWSLVGTDSRDERIVGPGEITLNLSGFDKNLPEGWTGTVIHEFGHALGFHHEHQTQAITCDFNWDLLYDHLGGPPNNWPKWKVDHNLKQLLSGGYTYSAHDSNSIMHYSFPSWMFVKGNNSPCFTQRNNELSATDTKMMERAYPYDDALVSKTDSSRISNLESILSIEGLAEEMKSFRKQHLDYYKENRLTD